jgi:hypothetical protein
LVLNHPIDAAVRKTETEELQGDIEIFHNRKSIEPHLILSQYVSSVCQCSEKPGVVGISVGVPIPTLPCGYTHSGIVVQLPLYVVEHLHQFNVSSVTKLGGVVRPPGSEH